MSKISTDLLRIFSITFIMFNHAGWWYFNEMGTPYERFLSHVVAWINQFGKPSVLFFIFLSGFAFGSHRLNENFSTKRFYLHRFLRIWIPYSLVSLFYYIDKAEIFSFKEFLFGLFTGGHKYHLYFIILISLIYVIFPILRKIAYSMGKFWLFFIGAALIHIISSLYNEYPIIGSFRIGLPKWIEIKPIYNMEPYEIFFISIFFFLYGLWASKLGNAPGYLFIKKRIPAHLLWIFMFFLVVLGYSFTLGDYYFKVYSGIPSDPAGRIWRISVIFYGLGVILFMQNLFTEKKSDIIANLSRASYLVYLIHPAILEYFRLLKVPYIVFSVILSSWILGGILTYLSRKILWIGFFLGDGDRIFRKDLVK